VFASLWALFSFYLFIYVFICSETTVIIAIAKERVNELDKEANKPTLTVARNRHFRDRHFGVFSIPQHRINGAAARVVLGGRAQGLEGTANE